jgi:hypothetical protein
MHRLVRDQPAITAAAHCCKGSRPIHKPVSAIPNTGQHSSCHTTYYTPRTRSLAKVYIVSVWGLQEPEESFANARESDNRQTNHCAGMMRPTPRQPHTPHKGKQVPSRQPPRALPGRGGGPLQCPAAPAQCLRPFDQVNTLATRQNAPGRHHLYAPLRSTTQAMEEELPGHATATAG